ncbi:MAG TPA: hypothetical protein VMH81_29100 [Bryobacteraceae bacterium]|nr:hypothetical protein [Bryobacteraceae bacterium]
MDFCGPTGLNVAWAEHLTGADPSLVSLEAQARIPMLGADPIELGLCPYPRMF